MSEVYLDLFTPPLTQSPASQAYHGQFRTPPDAMLWLSRLQPVGGLREQLESHGVTPRGVLHVGGHYGLELEAYLVAGFDHVTFFEPNPLALAVLRPHVAFWREWLRVFERTVQLEVVEAAVSDEEGEGQLHVAELEMLTSLHRPSADWIRVQDTVRVRRARLDDLVPDGKPFNVLNLDVQGHELQVFAGAERTLSGLDAVIVELSYRQRYEDGALAERVDRRLADAGYRRAAEVRRDADVADALYVRR